MMRLINARTLNFEEFEDESESPEYAILSHRWEEGEVSYQEAKTLGLLHVDGPGLEKIKQCCSLALQYEIYYVWADTCCIDKASSAELSEAINSMFRWYQQAKVCIAYLSDVQSGGVVSLSLWFTRGWTLQELLAPQDVRFFDRHWQPLGSKALLASDISEHTGVLYEVLMNEATIYSIPVAQRMSWARGRKCRRVEDIAYSLLGIFDVNMPLLYGEGTKAFRRLQEEIIKQNNDHTIFLWSATSRDRGFLLAPTPEHFDLGRTWQFRQSQKSRRPFAITNVGLSITLPLVPWDMNIYLGLLECELTSAPESQIQWSQPCLYLRRVRDSDLFEKTNFSGRSFGFNEHINSDWHQPRLIYIAMHPRAIDHDSTRLRPTQQINDLNDSGLSSRDGQLHDELYGIVIGSVEVFEKCKWESVLDQALITTTHRYHRSSGVIEMQPGTSANIATIALPKHAMIPPEIGVVRLEFDFRFHPCCIVDYAPQKTPHLVPRTEDPSFSKVYEPSTSEDHQLVPLTDGGRWLLRVDSLMGISVLLQGFEGDSCIARRQVRIRLTQETVQKRIEWVFNLRVSECPGNYCQSHA